MTTLSARAERRAAGGPCDFSGQRGLHEQHRCDRRNERAGVALSVVARGDGGSDVASSFLLRCVSIKHDSNFSTTVSSVLPWFREEFGGYQLPDA